MTFKSYSQYEDFLHRINYPIKETMDARDKFLAECDKLFVTRTEDGVLVECDDVKEGANNVER